jgi:hypothetical protein
MVSDEMLRFIIRKPPQNVVVPPGRVFTFHRVCYVIHAVASHPSGPVMFLQDLAWAEYFEPLKQPHGHIMISHRASIFAQIFPTTCRLTDQSL